MRLLSCIYLAVICIASCATTRDVEFREKIVGSWFLDVSVMGRRTQEVIKFNADGTYTARLLFSDESGLTIPAFERGTWLIEGGEYQFEAVEATYPPLRQQRRRIVTLNDSELLAVDSQFGIEIWRERVPDNHAFLPTGIGPRPGQ